MTSPPLQITFPEELPVSQMREEISEEIRTHQVVIVAGAPPGTVGSTNLIHVHRIGEEDH